MIEYDKTRTDTYRTDLFRTTTAASTSRDMQDNPFVISMLASGTRFADREAEMAKISAAFGTAGGKLIVYGDRRYGKSSALEHAAEQVKAGGGKVAIASLATASDAAEAAQRVVSAAQREVGSSWREVIEGMGRALRAGVEVTPSSDAAGMPGVRLSLGSGEPRDPNVLLPDVLDALNDQLRRRKLVLGLGLDEFQRIHEWGGENAEWALREAVQRHDAVAYVLAGSKRHLIEAMVGSKGRALWKLGDVLRMDAIDPSYLAGWLRERSAASGVAVPEPEAKAIVRLAGPRTRDVIQLARAVWAEARSVGRVAAGAAPAAFEQIAQEQAELYRSIFARLSARQQGVLRAFAAEPRVQITSAGAIRRYRLGPKSSVQSAVEVLVHEEHLTRSDAGEYAFDDPFFRRWVQTVALADIGVAPPALE